ncbi:MAG: methyltransferase family protein [Thiolinea sp.]
MLKTTIPPPIYALSCAGIMWWLDRSMPVAEWLSTPYTRIGLFVIVCGLLIDIWSLGQFFRSKTTPNPLKPENANTLVMKGLYRFTRNPMYLGMLTWLAGWGIYLGSLSPLIMLPVFIWVLTVQQIIPEETVLAEKFGDDYLAYKQKVRRWL